MMTVKNYQPITGPYRRRVNWRELAISALGHVAIGSLLAYSVLGMCGAWQ